MYISVLLTVNSNRERTGCSQFIFSSIIIMGVAYRNATPTMIRFITTQVNMIHSMSNRGDMITTVYI